MCAYFCCCTFVFRFLFTGLRKIELVTDAVSPTIESIAVDWVSDHIFWLESYPSKIRVAALDGSNPTTLIDNGLTNPKSMILDPIKG